MLRNCLRLALVALLVGLGWVAARAQTVQPDFEIVVTAPVGETTIECRRGCDLAWVQRGILPDTKMPTFTFKCGGSAVNCSSGRVGGWVTK